MFQRMTIGELLHRYKEHFSDAYLLWLPDNVHIWQAFEQEAAKVISKGYKHYSARTIVEVLRHQSAIAENSTSGWKINNDIIPYLARTFAFYNPHHANLFEYRTAHRALRDGVVR